MSFITKTLEAAACIGVGAGVGYVGAEVGHRMGIDVLPDHISMVIDGIVVGAGLFVLLQIRNLLSPKPKIQTETLVNGEPIPESTAQSPFTKAALEGKLNTSTRTDHFLPK